VVESSCDSVGAAGVRGSEAISPVLGVLDGPAREILHSASSTVGTDDDNRSSWIWAFQCTYIVDDASRVSLGLVLHLAPTPLLEFGSRVIRFCASRSKRVGCPDGF
jgi:hypothetical protein